MVGENTSLIGGLTAGVVLFALNMVVSFFMYRFKPIRNLIQSEPVTLIYNGKILDKNLKDVLLTDDELLSAVSEHCVSTIQDVSLAVMEVDGNISVISEDGNHFKRTQYKQKRHHKSLQDI